MHSSTYLIVLVLRKDFLMLLQFFHAAMCRSIRTVLLPFPDKYFIFWYMGLDTSYDGVETTVARIANFPININVFSHINILWKSQFFWRRSWSPSAMIPNLKSNANCYMLNQTYVVFLFKQLHIKSMIIFLTVLPVWPAGIGRGQCSVLPWVFSYKGKCQWKIWHLS